MQALIVISISVLYDEYIILLQWVSHNLNSIQRLLLKVLYDNYYHHNSLTQTTWTENSLSTSLSQLQKLKRDRAQWVSEKKVTKCHMKWLCMHCRDNDHFIKNCKLLLYNLMSSMLLLLRLWRRWQKKEELRKVAFSKSQLKCIRCDKAERSLKTDEQCPLHYVNINQ
jgi:hypothetical protein